MESLVNRAESTAPIVSTKLVHLLQFRRNSTLRITRFRLRLHPLEAHTGLEGNLSGLNIGEACNSLKRAVFLHRLGEIRDRTLESQSRRANGLNLVVAAIILWNTVYIEHAVKELRRQGHHIPDYLLPHIGPLGWDQIGRPS